MKFTIDFSRLLFALLLLLAARHFANDFLLGMGVFAAVGVIDLPIYSRLLWQSKGGSAEDD